MTHNRSRVGEVILTDGGQHNAVDETQQKELEQLFIEVTGTDMITEAQESHQQKRAVAERKHRTVSGYVAEITQNDGLDETLPEPETGGQE